MLFYGLPEGKAQMRRDRSTDLQMFGERILKKRYRRRLIEVVISTESPLISTQLCDKVFQEHYGATVAGVRPSMQRMIPMPRAGTFASGDQGSSGALLGVSGCTV